MADNVNLTAGDGTIVGGADVIGGVAYPRVKVVWGPDNTVNDTDVASGKPLPVQLRSATGLIPIGEPTDAKSTATDTTSITLMQAVKQISASAQLISTALGSTALDLGLGTLGSRTIRTILDSSQVATPGQATAANSAATVGASDRQNSVAFAVAMTTDTGIYASGDLIADTQQLTSFFNKTDGKGVINSVTIVEKDAQGAAYYILFHRTSTSMGTENSAPNISDANAAAGIQGIVAVATTDFVTVSGTKVACIRNLGIPVTSVSGTDSLYVSVLNATGTPTYAGGTIDLIIGGLLD